MIAVLRGHLLEKHPSRLIVDVHGVGYDVQVPVSTFYQAGETGNAVTLRIHTHVREDQIALFGFATALEHDLFERLIAVNGIGPKLALSVLSGLAPEELVQAIASANVARLTSIPGIGRKTAERIVLELKDKLAAMTPAGAIATPAGPREDLVSALLNLGYHRPAAEKAVDRALQDGPDLGFEQALRAALKLLSR